MSIVTPIILIIGSGALIWVVLGKLEEEAKQESRQPPRGRSINQDAGSQRRGTGSWPRSPSVVKTSTRKSRGNTKVVRHKEKPYWKRRGWKKRNGDLTGYYRTKYGTFKGKIENYRSKPQVYIYNPPKQLKNHPHSNCFFSRGNGKFKVHFKQKVKQPSLAIQTVEKIIRESFRNS